ncbi:MAG: DMT family transporter [Prevotella sp.]|jgi:drug/metabolite transporter (DMT)-like permease|nr:DMT family transporter [Prevotella sp.]MCH4099603.1 DMT family transporter [Prevotella sp.]MCI1473129.1 DMT family transporter [Prevotella sp.]MCI1549434.1 DMT family transporter [Prevotella sp.]MCI1596009.1 DMT family transporter [Prevotella sp.]
MINLETKAISSATVAVLSWSTVATAFKIALRYLTHFELLLVADSTALLIFSLILAFQNKWKLITALSLKQWGYFALLGLLNPVAYYLVLFKSYSLLPAQVAQPINYMWPIVLTILLAAFAHCHIPRLKYVGLGISLAGVAFISIGSSKLTNLHVSILGLSLAALSAVLWAVYWMITNKEKDKTDAILSLFMCFMFGTVYLVIGALFSGIHPLSFKGIISGVYVGCFEMGISFAAFEYAICKTSNPALVNQMCYLSPFLSLFFIAAILGEKIVVTTYIGLVLIVFGIIFNQYFVKIKTENNIEQ